MKRKRSSKEDEVLLERKKKDGGKKNKRSNLANGEATTSTAPGPSTSTDRGRSKVSEVISLSDSQNESSDNDSSSPWTNLKTINKPKCPYCGIMYEKRHHLIKHVTSTCVLNPDSKANKEAGKFRCVDCGRNYAQAKSLRYHQRHECQQMITCPDCGKTMRGTYITERHKQQYCVKKQRKKIKQEEDSPDELFIDDSSIEF